MASTSAFVVVTWHTQTEAPEESKSADWNQLYDTLAEKICYGRCGDITCEEYFGHESVAQ